MSEPMPYPYDGPAELAPLVLQALRSVVDPEVAMNIVDVGLVYGVMVAEGRARVCMTMTSAACPMAGLIVDEVVDALTAVLPADVLPEVQLVWSPPWGPERLSEAARRFMGW